MKITKELLESKFCCSPRLEKFVEMFPAGVEITAALCEKHAAGEGEAVQLEYKLTCARAFGKLASAGGLDLRPRDGA